MTKLEILFCPRCGVSSIERDRYGEQRTPPRYKNEWLCSSCGFGFCIDRSMRGTLAVQMAKETRKQRPPDEVKKEPKPRPDDEELNTLRRYAEKISMPYLIFRCDGKPWKFKFNSMDGITRGTLTFNKAMILLRGFELAGKYESV